MTSYGDGVPHDFRAPDETLVDMLEHSVKRFPRNTALEFFGATVSYRELGDAVDRAAAGLRKLGVAPGDRVALILPNCPQHIIAFYAVLRIGAIVVEHNPLYTAPELRHLFEVHHSVLAIVWDAVADTVAEFPPDLRPANTVSVRITDAMPLSKRIALRLPVQRAREARGKLTTKPSSRTLSWERIVSSRRISKRYPRPTTDDTALLQFTSGTTGLPKGAELTHLNLRANAAQGSAWLPTLAEGREVFYGVLPMFHAYGLTFCVTFAVSIGARIVLFPTFDTELVLAAMRRTPATFLPAVPPIYDALARAAVARGVDLSSIRFAFSGAMALPVATVTRWEELTGGILVEGYGMTESSPVALGNPAGPTRRPGTVGLPFPGTDIRVVSVDEPDTDVPLGERGELLIRGPQVFRGYWDAPAETAEVLLRDGWLRTGDIAIASEDGFVTIVDRLKELIISGGYNISPSEVEQVLLLHPDVLEAAVVGVPQPDGREQVAAAVVLRDGAVFDETGLRDFCRTHLTRYKVPRRITPVTELPRSLVGKVVRREVREQLLAQRAARLG